VLYVAVKSVIFKFASAAPITAICSTQKITDANGNWTIDGRYRYLIKSGDSGLLTPGCAYNIIVFAARRKVKKMVKKEQYVWEGS